MSKLKCLVATGNPHKVEEIRRIVGDAPIDLFTLKDFDPMPEPVEDGKTFLENAIIKSRYYSKATGLIALADDSGLEVDVLNGEPGIHSARYAGEGTPHSAKMKKVLDLLKDTPSPERTARFRCVAAATFPDGTEYHADGAMEGVIHHEMLGEGGFGYDPIVFIPELGKSVAQLASHQKDELSHRGKAFGKLLKLLLEH